MSELFNPVELAKAEIGCYLDPAVPAPLTETEENIMINLHTKARDHGFIDDRFWVESAQCLVLPIDYSDFDGRIGNLKDVSLGGVLAGYQKFSLYRRVAGWCLRFQDATLAPGFERLDDNYELLVPIISVNTIERL